MPRLSYFGSRPCIVTCIAALFSAPLSAQTPAANSPHVQHVIVRGSDVRGSDMSGSSAAIEVEIQTSGSVAPDTQAITGPDRIVVDFPGALPAAELRALQVNRGALKGIRSGLFFSNPPITRIVLDLSEPQSYQISTIRNTTFVKLGPVKLGEVKLGSVAAARTAPAAKLQNASLVAGTRVAGSNVAAPRVSTPVSNPIAAPLPAVNEAPPPPKPAVTVTFINGMLRIRADKATLAQVLFEVQRQTQAEIAIPAGAELGPAPARDVLASLLNGSSYNFIFVGDELSLERVILTRRDPNIF